MAVLRSSALLFVVGRQEVYFHIRVDKLLFRTKQFSLFKFVAIQEFVGSQILTL